MGEQDTEIEVGNRVRAGAGAGRVGTALRVVATRDPELSPDSVLVIFPGDEADYLNSY